MSQSLQHNGPEAREVSPAGRLAGAIAIPPDKSISHRAILFAGLAAGESRLRDVLRGEDCMATLAAMNAMGVASRWEPDGTLVVDGRGLDGLCEPGDVLDAGNSGTTMRLLTGVLAGQPFFSVLTGDATLRRRPMRRVIDPLAAMGARISGRDGGRLAPLAIQGTPLAAMDHVIPVASAQVKSALLLAGLTAEGVTRVSEPAKSRDHTERMLASMGADVRVDGLTVAVAGRPAGRP